MTRQQLYADLPQDLHEADDLLKRYGRWAKDRRKPERCASAEGSYKAPQNDDDRQPREVIMPSADVERVRAALLAVPTVSRTVLLWLYVPTGESISAKVRRCGLRPVDMRERHLAGVQEFWANWRRVAPMTKSTIAIRSRVLDNCVT